MSALNRIFRGSIKTKLVRVFVLQILAISIATVLGVYGAAFVVEQVLVREALNGEAEHFWTNREQDPSFPLPNTNNLRGWLEGGRPEQAPPDWLAGLEPGFERRQAADGRD
ncbi:MAG: hypothetical protein ACNA7J_13135, partial [Wenzhouxiangella sp.]